MSTTLIIILAVNNIKIRGYGVCAVADVICISPLLELVIAMQLFSYCLILNSN